MAMMTREEWGDKFHDDDKTQQHIYEAYRDSGAYYDTSRERFEEQMMDLLYAAYVDAYKEEEADNAWHSSDMCD